MRDNFNEGQKKEETTRRSGASGWGSGRLYRWIKKQLAPQGYRRGSIYADGTYYMPPTSIYTKIAVGPVDRWATDGGKVPADSEGTDPLNDEDILV